MLFLDKIFDNYCGYSCINGLTDELKILYVDYLFRKSDRNVLVVSSSLYHATKLFNMINFYNKESYFFPMDDFVSSVMTTPSPDLMIKRLETINNISNNKSIYVTNLEGFLKYMPSKDKISDLMFALRVGEDFGRKKLEDIIFNYGYNKTSIVTSTGEYSIRGYIVDIFPYNCDNPIRIEFFGDNIDCIKEFDADTQLSLKKINEITITPFCEIGVDDNTSLYDLLDNPLVVKIDGDMIDKAYNQLEKVIFDYNVSQGFDVNKKYMFSLDDIRVNDYIELNNFDNKRGLKVISSTVDSFKSNLEGLEYFISHRKNNSVVLFSIDSSRLKGEIESKFNVLGGTNYCAGCIYFVDYKINHGFMIDNYIVISESDITSEDHSSTYYNPIRIGRKVKDFNELKIGDFIVHRSHGIGIYGGVVNLVKSGFSKDYILLKYGSSDKIYIPVEKINTIYKYADADNKDVKVNSLNSTAWVKAKRKVKARIKDISEELIKLYAERSKIKSPKFKSVPEEVMFAEDFDFVETNDQLKCINDVLNDLSFDKPMDRLLCGDVGFGKTEIAFRAIFRTVMNGYQAAYLCPTTILSKQQYNSALHRFRNFPVKIALVNRFTSVNEFNEIVSDLKSGKIDILFGTHKLFNNSIVFKNLGLLVVDEEQRFGVSQKEKIKELCNNINVLTLSATPIPRTLKMAISGLRDLSILDTAPVNRFPVQTYVAEENDILIKEVIYKELSRNGQVYYLFNNVENLEDEVFKLSKLVPDARICFAHGRLDKVKLDKVIDDFVNYKYDVLVCTTIIETGIDISNVNTIIIKNAQNFGLSQLYQIRGRVGRTDKIAYAYLLYKRDKVISEVAEKRLNAIKEFTELGSGYKIAMRDLSIRGAGDLLGSEQAGFIETVGIDLFTKMIEESINEINGLEYKDDNINSSLLDVNTHISSDYVQDESVRIEIHQLINLISDKDSMTRIKNEIEDRFGKVDENLIIYMYEEWFEKLALKLDINRVIQTKNYVEFELPVHISDKINGEKLFLVAYNIYRKFIIKYINNKIVIRINLNGLDKHYLYYLVSLLENIVNDVV